MRWDNVIFGYVLVTYIVFIAMRGEIPVYMGFLLSSASNLPKADGSKQAASSPGLGGMLATVGRSALTLGPLVGVP